VETTTFIYMMLVLKLPIVALLWVVWWAVRATPEVDVEDEGDGGMRRSPHGPRPPRTPKPRRGPHADPPPAAPARVRSVVAHDRDTHAADQP
jgi:hypothetical protein